MNFVNLCPHTINVARLVGDVVAFPPSGVVARVASATETLPPVGDFRLSQQTFGEVQNLPEPKTDTVYIVSGLVLAALKGSRPDCVGLGFGPDAGTVYRRRRGRRPRQSGANKICHGVRALSTPHDEIEGTRPLFFNVFKFLRSIFMFLADVYRHYDLLIRGIPLKSGEVTSALTEAEALKTHDSESVVVYGDVEEHATGEEIPWVGEWVDGPLELYRGYNFTPLTPNGEGSYRFLFATTSKKIASYGGSLPVAKLRLRRCFVIDNDATNEAVFYPEDCLSVEICK